MVIIKEGDSYEGKGTREQAYIRDGGGRGGSKYHSLLRTNFW